MPGSAAALPALLAAAANKTSALWWRGFAPPGGPAAGRPGSCRGVREGYDADLDAILDATAGARDWIAGLEDRERAAHGHQEPEGVVQPVFGYTINIIQRQRGPGAEAGLRAAQT
ncbi:MAG: hypothetical protein IPL60_08340 [Ardenticatenia bacterium]|nr:hypothetical protein [Ardenticatenia bacterium]